jgi:kynurenine---oxoglutarate transaminase / cysteine-S-conjugate beta-lyase / glutamine---phenylpyruvate transaminase
MISFDKPHVRIATLPGMWERTVTLGSSGKALNTTGWKVGWAYGPSELMQPMQDTQQVCFHTLV